MAPNRKRSTKRVKKDIRLEAMEMVTLALEQNRYQDAMEGLNLLKAINHGDKQAEWEQVINMMIVHCHKGKESYDQVLAIMR